MTKIRFIRHGETDWNIAGKLQGRTDIPLNESGIKQAQACGISLLQNEWDLIITSPLLRAKETGQIIQQKLNIPLHEMTSFIEVAFGDAEGLTYYERDVRFPNRDYPNKETEAMVTERFLKGIHTVHQNYTNKNILIVSHGAFINAIFHYFSNGTVGTGVTKLTNGSFSTLEINNNHTHILDYNTTHHLPAQNPKS
ncbi:histidine phosphatase family protein [Staphylococcus cohnii]|uniref:Histidine phosphatase family protein n=2 Tax=Staphylococcus cohnii TaxID=29382 RepID=A0ABT6J0H1_9STAP|nr:histidine phosphatase family protein [Staphylococcus cohnii]TGP64868.1 histidine phosphatase family protein [bacterium M00.F.Ca.ET.229.01.1.1]TGS41360.1 histidine phosphatase family protein [bacterium M00.F.Ca.ET.180.01.1.1]AYX88851.1 histidine phosphatase family protein [Staphylococcus cohnii]KKI63929.1 putative broad substrate specificity phosphatase [Staphylococcus cohnii subsp. cohnii]MCI2940503.1 histidine phosphatase family protein [Staphylococcus cohnii]